MRQFVVPEGLRPWCDNQIGKKFLSIVSLVSFLLADMIKRCAYVVLKDTTTQMIETIWPLSVLSCTRDSQPDGSDQILIGLRTFVQEVLRRSKTSYYTLQVALYYLILIKAFVPTCDFTMEQLVDSPSCRAMQCGRRMFLTALILASKYLQDRNYSARAWSKISGLKTSEINANEMAFLAAIKWKLHVPEPLFNRWMDIVLKYSPSSSTLPMSPSISAMSWRSIIPRITPDLDDFEFGSVNFAKDSKNLYLTDRSGPSALPTPPPESFSLTFFEPNEQTPTNPCNRKAPELTPSGTLSDRPILPPLQCPGLLPTPTMTPQTGTLCTPAMSAYGPCNIKSSMSAVMSQVQGNSLARSTLDNLNNWKSSCNAAVTTSSRRSSLAPSNSTFSSPESMVSDLSSRRSRSSSISSVASSTCALPQLRLAMQATRRCAQMKLSSLKEGDQSIILSSPPEDSTWDVFNTSPDDVFSTGGDYFSKPHHNPPSTPSTDLDLTATGYKARTHEAVTTLHELALPHRSVYSSPTRSRKRENTSSTDLSTTSTTQGSGDKLHRAMPCPSTRSRKRERPSSTDLSVQSRVRELIAPRCLGDITNGTRPTAKSNTVLPDPQLPASFLVHNQNYLSSSNVKLNHKMKNVAPRKRTCGVSGTKENCNLNHRLFQERLAMPAPGMWDGII